MNTKDNEKEKEGALSSTEQALRESEAKYRLLADIFQEGIWIIDKDSHTTYVNPHMAKMLGYSVEEMQGRHLFSFMDEQGVEICNHNLKRRQQGIKEQHDFEFLRKDGSRAYMILDASPIIDKAGNYAGAIAGVVDITERIQAENALRESEERNRALLKANPDMMFVFDRNGVFIDYSAGIDSPLLLSPEFFIGKNIFEVMPHEVSVVTHNNLKKVFQSGQPQIYEYQLEMNGHQRYYESRLVRYGESKALAIVRDITDRKRAADALKKKADELQRFNDLMVDREIRMVELKKEINELLVKAGKEEKYVVHDMPEMQLE